MGEGEKAVENQGDAAPKTPDGAGGRLLEAIRSRTSWRSYTGRPLNRDEAAALRQVMADMETPFGSDLRIELLQKDESGSAALTNRATYGVVRGAPAFLAGAIRPEKKSLTDLGFALETLVLEATALGLGTCWLGGSFSRDVFSRELRLGEDERVPCVVAVGEHTPARALHDRAMRFFAGSPKRKPSSELFFDTAPGRPLTEAMAGETAFQVLECVRLAPSAANAQEWRIVRTCGGRRFELFVRRSTWMKSAQRVVEADFALIDAGIAMCHFQTAARALGLAGSWTAKEAPLAAAADGLEFIAVWR